MSDYAPTLVRLLCFAHATLCFECWLDMNNIYIPVHVALLLRRLANVISGLSISNQYLLVQRARADERADARLTADHSPSPAQPTSVAQWPKWMQGSHWDWPRMAASSLTPTSDSLVLKCMSGRLLSPCPAHITKQYLISRGMLRNRTTPGRLHLQ